MRLSMTPMASTASHINLDDLRSQLTRRMALLFSLVAGVVAWALLPGSGFSPLAWGFALILVVMSLTALVLEPRAPLAARFVLVSGPTLILALGMVVLPAPWFPFLGLIPVMLGAMLITGSEVVIGVILTGVAFWLMPPMAGYAPGSLAAVMALSVGMAWLIRHSLYTALQWAWSSEQQAAQLLDEVRSHRGQLSQMLKSYALANARLRRAERELIIARKQSDEARRIKEQFAANVSHELRTPLNLILGFSEIMYRTPEVYGPLTWPAKLRRDIYQIHRSSQHLLTMVDDILSLSRLEMARFDLHTEPTSIGQLVENTVEIVRDLFHSNEIGLVVEVAPSLPTVVVDPTRIRQVLLNLLSNALRHTERGEVRVRAWCDDEAVTVCVSDTGPGIAPEKLPHVFEEFYQVDLSLRRSTHGAGLGLAISKRFVEMHDGRIWVESVEGQGARFYFTIPLPDRYAPLARPHVEQVLEMDRPASNGCVLVVDPDSQTARRLAGYLQGWDILQVAQPEQASAAIAQETPRAIVHNLRPGEPVPDSHFANAPVPVIHCCLPSRAWLTGTRQVVACLSKPVTREQLVRAVQESPGVRTVLIIDDDRGFCQLVRRHLESAGLPITLQAAYSGEDGLQMLHDQPPDLLLLDLLLPGVSGFDVLRTLGDHPTLNRLPVVLLTATTDVEDSLFQRSGKLVVSSSTGLQPREVLRGIASLVTAFEPRYGTQPVYPAPMPSRPDAGDASPSLDDPQLLQGGEYVISTDRLGENGRSP